MTDCSKIKIWNVDKFSRLRDLNEQKTSITNQQGRKEGLIEKGVRYLFPIFLLGMLFPKTSTARRDWEALASAMRLFQNKPWQERGLIKCCFSIVCQGPCLHRHSSLEGCRTAPSCPAFDGKHQGRGCSQNARTDGETGSSLGPASLWGCKIQLWGGQNQGSSCSGSSNYKSGIQHRKSHSKLLEYS